MHYTISILTGGENRGDARARALEYADRLVDEGEFDFYDPESAKTYKLHSELGKKAVEGALAATRREFDVAIRAVRLMLQEFTDEQIYQDEYPAVQRSYDASRWQFAQVADGRSYIYGDHDLWGEAIRNDKDYQVATEGHGDLWVTCMNFHTNGQSGP